jgi:predicted nucleic acid-binding protein
LVLIVSDFAAAEFSSVIARHVRTKEITKNDARIVFSAFDTWTTSTTQRAVINGADIIAAEVLLRRLDLALRTPDALNIAIAQRMGATLVTFDKKMAVAARAIGAVIARV